MGTIDERENTVAKAVNDLNFIRKVMEATRFQSLKNGVFYQIWGLLIPLCSVANLILLRLDHKEAIGPLWGIVMALGAVSCFIIGFSQSKNESGRKEEKLNGRVWIGILFGSVAIISLEIAGLLPVIYGLFSLCLLLMVGAVVEASLTSLKGFFVVASGWFLVGLSLIVFKEHVGPLFLGIMTFPLSFVPGTILTILYRRERRTD